MAVAGLMGFSPPPPFFGRKKKKLAFSPRLRCVCVSPLSLHQNTKRRASFPALPRATTTLTMAADKVNEVEGLMRVAGVSHYMRTNATNIDIVRACGRTRNSVHTQRWILLDERFFFFSRSAFWLFKESKSRCSALSPLLFFHPLNRPFLLPLPFLLCRS